ncbi:MAG: CRISPR-associated endonuclease Cas1 [Eubacterium sp.]|uniref:CRISPR-associated endonuclease Cas1 n=1 Tax=Candidatus Weimeria bifida TaxID=2599074 RepID=A0A6N7IX07_9FIRM|nr:CRISPR-associated endonuclease Cas1 [Eubacterium sp.]MQN00823.1 CRISPR-associated endonuclease Cas1 [Candidatus Weimeria bifida]RRF94306.1 MAG: CRISPR-associated endonuclease Cas1 [Lachnospiraceae bacterium]
MIVVGKILYIMTDGLYLNVDHDSVEIGKDKRIITRIPLVSLSQIIVIANVTISAYLLSSCNRSKISISYISPFGRYLGTFNGTEVGNVSLRMKQYDAFKSEEKIKIAKNIVLGKTVNQMAFLARYSARHPNVEKVRSYLASEINVLLDSDSVEQIRGIEGDCAAKYFSTFDELLEGCDSEMKFVERSRRPPKNCFNSLLSLLYTIETTTCTAAVCAYGLDPYLGYLHEIHPGRASLSCDLVEEFRTPVIDSYVIKSVNLKKITAKDFEESEGTFSLTSEGKKKVLTDWEKYKETKVGYKLWDKEVPIKVLPFLQAQLLGQYLRGDISEYPPFTDWR